MRIFKENIKSASSGLEPHLFKKSIFSKKNQTEKLTFIKTMGSARINASTQTPASTRLQLCIAQSVRDWIGKTMTTKLIGWEDKQRRGERGEGRINYRFNYLIKHTQKCCKLWMANRRNRRKRLRGGSFFIPRYEFGYDLCEPLRSIYSPASTLIGSRASSARCHSEFEIFLFRFASNR